MPQRDTLGGLDEAQRLPALAEHYRERLLRDEEELSRLAQLPRPRLRVELEQLIARMVAEERVVLSRTEREQLLEMVLNESVGFGPLEPLLQDPDVTEIMVNGPADVYAERKGRIELTGVRFKDDEHIRHIIDRIIGPLGRRIDESSPMVDARLPEGHRVNAVIPPVSLSGPVVTIRKFRRTPLSMEDLIRFGTLTAEMSHFLVAAVRAKLNILISGGTGSGKTTFLAALAAGIPEHERVLIIEDMAELRLNRRHVLSMEARPANVEGTGEITIRQLVRNALRMRPDRIIVGEVRGSEAMDMLQAMNTGHEGSMTTIHANNTVDSLSRLEAMVIMAGTAFTVDVIRQHLVAALDLIVQTERMEDGRRRVVSIAEVLGTDPVTRDVQLKELFTFRRTGITDVGEVLGGFVGCGVLPTCWQRMKAYGVAPPESVFDLRG